MHTKEEVILDRLLGCITLYVIHLCYGKYSKDKPFKQAAFGWFLVLCQSQWNFCNGIVVDFGPLETLPYHVGLWLRLLLFVTKFMSFKLLSPILFIYTWE